MSIYYEENDAKKSNNNSKITRIRILLCLKDNGSMRIEEMSNALKIHRTSVTRNCKELVEAGLIWKENKQAKYQLSEMAMTEPMLYRRIYKSYMLKKIWGIKPSFDDNRLSSTITNEKDEIELYKFANKIGAIITYLFLQAIQPYKDLKISKSTPSHSLLKEIIGNEKDESISKWIRKVIDPVEIFEEFCDLNLINRAQVKDSSNSNFSRFEIVDQDNFNKILGIFQNVFPLINRELEKHAETQERNSSGLVKSYEQDKNEQRKETRKFRNKKHKIK